jgi:hypothetical protein
MDPPPPTRVDKYVDWKSGGAAQMNSPDTVPLEGTSQQGAVATARAVAIV